MKIVIVGCGKVGGTLAEQLVKERHNITMIDRDGKVLRELTDRIDINGVEGNGATYTIQKEAGVPDADLLIATTGQDEVNLLCCLIAKKSGCQTIARVRNPEYVPELSAIKDGFGLSMLINPELATAREISRLMRFPSAIKVDTFAKGRVELLKVRIPNGSRLDKMKVSDIVSVLRCNVLVCILERDGKVIIPDGQTQLFSGDVIDVIVPPKGASSFFKQIGIVNNRIQSATLAGGGKISLFLARLLIDSGIDVKIIELSPARCEVLSDLIPEATIILGDATDLQLLKEEAIDSSECFVALTDMDEENVMLSLYVGSQSKAKLVTKINRVNFEEVYEQLPIGSIIRPKQITATLILQYVRAMQNSYGSNVETLLQLNGAEILEFRVRMESKATGIPLQKLNLKPNLLLGCISRNNRILTPRGRDTIEVGDTVIVVTTNTGLDNLDDILA